MIPAERQEQILTDPALGPTPERRAGPWGFWATLGLSVVIGAGYVVVQTVVVAVAVIAALQRTPNLDVHEFGRQLARNGLFWSVAVCAGAPVTIGLTVLFASLARGMPVRDYLALHWRGWKVIAAWLGVMLLFIAFADAATYLLRGRLVPPLLEEVYRTAYFVPLLWFAIVVVAPLAEEVFFRGFFFRGIECSRAGPVGAIVLTSFAWAALHTQYDLYGVAVILVGGLLLGYARLRSGTLYVPLALHMAQNLVATLEVVLSLSLTPYAV